MKPSLKLRYEQAQDRLIMWSAPKLKAEDYVPLRPPVFKIKLGELLAAKGVTL